VTEDAQAVVVEAAYPALCKVYHPGADGDHGRIVALNRAVVQ
jgi:hypothetical protein